MAYKTISVSVETYQQLNSIANKLKKPKAWVVAEMIQQYGAVNHNEDEKKRKEFNKRLDKSAKKLAKLLPKDFKIDYQNLDELFDELDPEDY